MQSLQECVIGGDRTPEHVRHTLRLVTDKLSQSSRLVNRHQDVWQLTVTVCVVMDNGAFMNRSGVKRCKERCLEEAAQLLRAPEAQLGGLEEGHLLLLVKLLLSMQLQTANISSACRKVDQVSPSLGFFTVHVALWGGEVTKPTWFALQMLQHLAKVDHQLVFRETRHCLLSMVHTDQVQSSVVVRVFETYTFCHQIYAVTRLPRPNSSL